MGLLGATVTTVAFMMRPPSIDLALPVFDASLSAPLLVIVGAVVALLFAAATAAAHRRKAARAKAHDDEPSTGFHGSTSCPERVAAREACHTP
eukprot:gene929-2579_t